ncbi:amino acid ABC transporter permease [Shinella sp. S4-D37]|uniref:amino acid ABC transporter permease n=1 Tax=Shinella sp. S4-D37 TaxID=3161999 RepID=UPI0034678A28
MEYQFDLSWLPEQWPMIQQGIGVTLYISFITTVLGILLGSICAVLRTAGPRVIRSAVAIYVEVIRNTPLLIQAYFVIFGCASAGFPLPIYVGAILVLTVNIGAYTTEIVRAGIEAINRGQHEAATCLALNTPQIYIYIIIPQALAKVYPALTSQYVLLLLSSSLLSSVGVDEIFSAADRIQSITYRNFEVMIVIGIIYLMLSMAFRLIFQSIYTFMFGKAGLSIEESR